MYFTQNLWLYSYLYKTVSCVFTNFDGDVQYIRLPPFWRTKDLAKPSFDESCIVTNGRSVGSSLHNHLFEIKENKIYYNAIPSFMLR